MRVLVNQLQALKQKTGIGHYTGELLRCLGEQAGSDRIDAFPEGCLRRLMQRGGRSGPTASNGTSSGPLAALRRKVVDGLQACSRALLAYQLKRTASRGGFQLYHEPNYIPLHSDLPTVVTVCDLSVLLHPEWHPAHRVALFERHFHRGLGCCAHVLAISEFGRQEIVRTLGLPPQRVTRTYMGIRADLGPLPAEEVKASLRHLGLPPRYLLHVGTIEPRKNVLQLMRVFCSLPDRLRARCPLVLVGGWGWNTADVADYWHREARHRSVLHVGYLPEQHLAAVYNGARALVFPTHYEGFGLPPLEMMACGGAVLASTAGAVAETVGRRAYLIDPGDTDGWRAGMERVLTDDDWWRSLRRGATEVARPFTWDRCAAETLEVYRAVCGEKPATEWRRAG